ncbi:hypothetical protein AN217_03300 [Streptomyces qinglanensis]|uniref:Uncharacterized protein n=1 Tax=Streptomyces qinglanensis TaxID=943816 RepID=A0A1E7KEC0_9ACTN|nr:hypothetical protein AN217_03300 [Streptomyces qinglanensis]
MDAFAQLFRLVELAEEVCASAQSLDVRVAVPLRPELRLGTWVPAAVGFRAGARSRVGPGRPSRTSARSLPGLTWL